MIRHIVLFRLSAEEESQKQADRDELVARLRSLEAPIPSVLRLEVGPDERPGPAHWDVALCTVHADAAAVDDYEAHPAHLDFGAWSQTVTSDVAIVDIRLT